MASAALEIHRLSPALTIWQRYDPQVKADLFSTAITTPSGIYLVDLIDAAPDSLPFDSEATKVAGIVVSNGNHLRASLSFADRLQVPVFARPEAEISSALPIADGEQLSPDLRAIAIEGAAPGEIALHWDGEGGVLIVGDALINFGPHGFTLLPAKYCANQKLMRKSLRRLLDLSFSRILFAHGNPIVTNARNRLIGLLGESQ